MTKKKSRTFDFCTSLLPRPCGIINSCTKTYKLRMNSVFNIFINTQNNYREGTAIPNKLLSRNNFDLLTF